ncbi:dehydrogenase [Candidatus Epulonipiscium fishelsonii]|uniref:Dehydrogenase n=1 Tax=Candidatus Epulonipiscium fishelsonii TaxID=77094 RepID=A0ACC8X9S4_9FIRM|nr:dehydrogenase [Epulopiscium sp. SCG-B05WGA-EpuloA1]ONI39063.1 dehydrogenase [Epulopiscium sp. SCG-B11WGA-EpuloA1]
MIIDRIKTLLTAKLISRRSFLKTSVASSITLLGLTGCGSEEETVVAVKEEVSSATEPVIEETPLETVAPREKGEVSRQTCPRNCHDTCSILSEVKDGRIINITGDPTNPITAGGLCVKMNHYKSWVYHADRLLYPMKRVGAKGEGKFEQISWDEALETIATKIKENVDKFGPESVLKYYYSGNLGFVQNYGMMHAFFNKLGASELATNICTLAGDKAIPFTYGKDKGIDPEEYANTNLYVSWGANEAATNVHTVKFIKQCKENGGKVVVINPVRTGIANFADQFIQIKPGTDAVFVLAVINYIIENNLQDQAYIDAYTIGFEELKATASEYTMEKASQITGVSVEQIEEFAKLYGTTKPSILRIGYGMQRNSNGGTMVRAITLLPALIGAIGAGANSGYIYINISYWAPDYVGGLQAKELLQNPVRSINMNELGKALTGGLETTKETPISTLVVFNSNPMAITQHGKLVREGLSREDLFTVVLDIFRTDTADYADIILPAATFFEYEDLNQDYLGYYLRHNAPAIEPLGESKSNIDIFNALAKKMGYTEPIFDKTEHDAVKICLETEIIATQGITYDTITKQGWVKLNIDVPFADKKFETPSGKIEFYSEKLKEAGFHPVAEYVPTAESEEGDKELFAKYPLTFITSSTKNLLNSQMHNVPQVRELMGEPYVFIHIDDATERGIVDGDSLDVTNDRGTIKLIAKVTSSITKKGTLISYKSTWPKLVEGGKSINEITSDRLADMGGGSAYHTNLVEVSKAK